MEQPQYLIDTNAVIDYLGKNLPDKGMDFMNGVIDTIPNVSVITKIEVLSFNPPEVYNQMLNDFMNDAIVFDLTNDIVETSIMIRKKYKTKLPDAVIAATAIVYDLTLITRDAKDFQSITELKSINPHQ
jgi:predicted nucleic acid-binding protein